MGAGPLLTVWDIYGFICHPEDEKCLAKAPVCNYNVITMKAKIIDIGNSKGIRLPKSLLEQLGFESEVQLEVTKEGLIIKPSHTARFDWAKSFHAMAQAGDDKLLDDYTPTSWDIEEWEWK